MINYGTVKPGSTLYLPFDSFASSTGASITLTGLNVTDIEIYKDGSTTQRASDNGYTLLDTDGIDFDGITGIHGFSIDLADNSTAGFYAAGSRYFIVVSSVTVDSQTVTFIAGRFIIGYEAAFLNTTIASLSSQTSFTLTSGPAEDDALNGTWLIAHDVASAVQMAIGVVLDYTGATKTVTLAAAPTFTIAATDNISVMGLAPLQPTVMGRTLDVSAGGDADAAVQSIANNAITANSINADAFTAAKFAADVTTEFQSGLATAAALATVDDFLDTEIADIQARLPAALVSGRMDASIGAVAANAITAAGLAADVTTELQAGLATAAALDAVDNFLDTEVAAILAAVDTEIADIQARLPAALVGGRIDANVGAISADATAADNAEAFFDGTGYAGTNNVIPSVTTITGNVNGSVASVAAGGITATSIATGAFDADALAADAATEIATAITGSTLSELGVAAPSATPTLAQAVMLIYMALRNKRTVTATKDTLFNDAGTAIAHADLTDDGTTFTASELASGA